MNKNNYLQLFEKYLSGVASEEEVNQIALFMQNDKKLNKWLEEEMIDSSSDIDINTKMRMLNHIRSKTNHPLQSDKPINTKKKKIVINLKKIANIAAILLPVAIALSVYLYMKLPNDGLLEIVANKGQKASLVLPEGSSIALNSDSKIIYSNSYNIESRKVQLRGEAYFDVVRDPDKPFIVDCGDVRIKVLGTSFGIKSYEEDHTISIILESGKIQLNTPLEEIEMSPNDYIVYDKQNKTTIIEKVNAKDYTDWRYNRLRFDNEKLETIMKTISRMHNIDIVFENKEIGDMKFTGTIDNTHIESILDAIKLTSSIAYKIDNGIVFLSIK